MIDCARTELSKRFVYTIDTMGYLEGAIYPLEAILKLIYISLSMDRLLWPIYGALCQYLSMPTLPMCFSLWGRVRSHKPRSLGIELEMSKQPWCGMGHGDVVGSTSMGLKAYRPHSPWGTGAQPPIAQGTQGTQGPQPRGVGGIGPYFTRGHGGRGGQGHQGPQATGRTIIHTSFRKRGLSCTDQRSRHSKIFSFFSCSLTPPTSLKTGLLAPSCLAWPGHRLPVAPRGRGLIPTTSYLKKPCFDPVE